MIIFDEEFGDDDWISYDIIYKNAETMLQMAMFSSCMCFNGKWKKKKEMGKKCDGKRTCVPRLTKQT